MMSEQKVIKINNDFDPSSIINKNTTDSILDKYINSDSEKNQINEADNFPQQDLADILHQELTAPQPIPRPETLEEKYEKVKLRGTIKKYLSSRFSEYLTEFKSIDTTTLTKQELEDLLFDIRLTVDSHESNIFDFESYISAAATIEHILVSNGFQVQGMTNNLHKSQKIPRLVDQISLARDLQMKPELQLLLLTVYTIKATTDHNKANSLQSNNPNNIKITENLKKPASKNLKDKYKDLDS